jgi:hypothetical protein
MRDKYYTPTEDEFHVGFEYENYFRTKDGNQWNKIEYSGDCEELMIGDYIDPNIVRVKCLDIEDIESLGFVQGDIPWRFTREGLEIRTPIGKYNKMILLIMNTIKKERVFLGELKNKSELKRIIRQVI